jgi:excisionase family DNA binding protein
LLSGLFGSHRVKVPEAGVVELGGNGGRMEAQRDDLLTPAEVAKKFRVDPKTVTRWAKAGKLSSIRTLGGHRRYRKDEVDRFLESNMQTGAELR